MTAAVADVVRRDTQVKATLKARAALVGVVLYVTDADRSEPLYIASPQAMTRAMSSVAEVESFLFQLGERNA